jgi:hypothetical protein
MCKASICSCCPALRAIADMVSPGRGRVGGGVFASTKAPYPVTIVVFKKFGRCIYISKYWF